MRTASIQKMSKQGPTKIARFGDWHGMLERLPLRTTVHARRGCAARGGAAG
jgi:hypothetical protein